MNVTDIDNDYTCINYENMKLQIMKKNGYINVTNLCKAGGKRYRNWNSINKTKELRDRLSKKLGIKNEELTVYVQNNHMYATFAHPDLVLNIAMWISPCFYITINEIIKTWRKMSNDNEFEYWNKMSESLKTPYKNIQIEEEVKNNLSKKLNGTTEVLCESGYIDIVTDKEIIEVKHIDDWKHALEQVLSYIVDKKYNTMQPRIHLFSEIEIEVEIKRKIMNVCSRYMCIVTFENI